MPLCDCRSSRDLSPSSAWPAGVGSVVFGTKWRAGWPGHRRFVGADADASIASLALAALDVLPGECDGVRHRDALRPIRGRALFDRGFSSVFLEGRLVADALSTERWAFYEPLYRSALLARRTRSRSPRPMVRGGMRWRSVRCAPVTARSSAASRLPSVSLERKRVEQQLLGWSTWPPDASVLADGEGGSCVPTPEPSFFSATRSMS